MYVAILCGLIGGCAIGYFTEYYTSDNYKPTQQLAAASEHSPAELARRVASPGGSTQKGLDVLDQDRALFSLIEATLRASRDRNAEMAAAARG